MNSGERELGIIYISMRGTALESYGLLTNDASLPYTEWNW